MTNKEDHGQPHDPRVAALLAVHLVGQVLDEACVIAIAAQESGQPWNYISMLKNLRNNSTPVENDENITNITPIGDDASNETDADVATSTPEKVTDSSSKNENSLIGQGDTGDEARPEDLKKSTSMFINNLFDMSDVEQVVICDSMDIADNNPASNDLLTQAMSKIMESYVNSAFNIVFAHEAQVTGLRDFCALPKTEIPRAPDQPCFKFLTDPFGGDIENDITFFVKNGAVLAEEGKITEIIENEEEGPKITEIVEVVTNEDKEKEDVIRYENAYLTLNRDYEQGQCSDEDMNAIIQDTKAMVMQDVELMNTTNTSEENPRPREEPVKAESKELAAISAVSASSRKSKSSLASRCKTTGARLLSCLRGWWRRKTPRRRKDSRHGSILGRCPMSPEARRRAASLLDQRHLYSPGAPRSVAWKFNTVNETVVNSTKWKEYTFEMKLDSDEKLTLEDLY